jgi:hypothetical protein
LGAAFNGVTGEIVAVVFGTNDGNKHVIRLTFVPLTAARPKNYVAGRRASEMFRRGENVAQSHANVRYKLTGTHQASLPGQAPSIIVEKFLIGSLHVKAVESPCQLSASTRSCASDFRKPPIDVNTDRSQFHSASTPAPAIMRDHAR